jgi:ankyrin repeat protein
MAYFYCDFRDHKKQSVDGFLSSLLVQFCAQSEPCCDLLSGVYSTHARGSRRPSTETMTRCLMDMLKILLQEPTYIVVDALDECPGTPGLPSSRATLLGLIRELINRHITNLRICVLSDLHPEVEFVLYPLASRRVCLHEESGHSQDIIRYLRWLLSTHPRMKGWKASDKQVVINTLFRKAEGVFFWIIRQMDILPRSLPATVVRVVEGLPETLDQTYERILLRVAEENWEHTYHVFHTLMVATRPLTMEELCLVLAIDFIAEVTPKYEEIWRSDEPEDNLLTVCSTLLSFVDIDGSRFAQFAHYSVKDFLTSERILTYERKIARYRMYDGPAHTTVAQMCLAVLLHLDERTDKCAVEEIPMIHYAAENWVYHARFGNVATEIQPALELLFDPKNPHLAGWVWLHDIDNFWGESKVTANLRRLDTAPLYYAAQCGFSNIAEYLLSTFPRQLNTLGSRYGTPLIAALENDHLEIAWMLLNYCADTTIRAGFYGPPLIVSSKKGQLEIVRFLLEQGDDVNVWDIYTGTPLHVASGVGHLDVVRLLLEFNADVNIPGGCYGTPLRAVTAPGHLGAAQLLRERSVDIHTQGGYHGTPLHAASADGQLEIARLLLEHGANANARAINGETPLQVASRMGHVEVVRLLLQNGADASIEAVQIPIGPPKVAASAEKGPQDVVRVVSEYRMAHVEPVEEVCCDGHCK